MSLIPLDKLIIGGTYLFIAYRRGHINIEGIIELEEVRTDYSFLVRYKCLKNFGTLVKAGERDYANHEGAYGVLADGWGLRSLI